MFVQELSPIFQEFVQKPIAFMGGFASGLLRLNLADDPVRSWLDQEMDGTVHPTDAPQSRSNGSGGPQSIEID